MSKLLVVFFSSSVLDKDALGPHIKNISRYADVICVEPCVSFSPSCRRGLRCNVIRENPNLYVLRPEYLVPYTLCLLFPVLFKINRSIIGRRLRETIAAIKADYVIASIRHPGHYGMLESFKYDMFCYELNDNWHAFPGLNKRYSRAIWENEEMLFLLFLLYLTDPLVIP